jgi:type I restriction enzyme M protein
VSLPAGVFNPYSGVKTSILILDKALAKRSDTVGFFKVESDGFGLGAQRRPVEQNDLPTVLEDLRGYLTRLRNGESGQGYEATHGWVVKKARFYASTEFSLSGERYRDARTARSEYEQVPAGSLMRQKVETIDPRDAPDELFELWSIPAYDIGRPGLVRGVEIGSQKKAVLPGDVLLSRIIPHLRRAWAVTANADRRRQIASTEWIIFARNDIVPEFLRRILLSDPFHARFMRTITGVGGSLVRANIDAVAEINVPLPPMDVQQAIVAEIEGYQRVIDGARAVVENYRPHIAIDPAWPLIGIGSVARVTDAITTEVEGELPYIGADSIEPNTGKLIKKESASMQSVSGPVYRFSGSRLLYSKIRPYLNKLTIVDFDGYCSSDMYPLLIDTATVEIQFLANYMLSQAFLVSIRGYYERASIPKINRVQLFQTRVPLPPLATQQGMVAEIEAEQALVNANRELIARFEKKIQATLARVWGDPAGEQNHIEGGAA